MGIEEAILQEFKEKGLEEAVKKAVKKRCAMLCFGHGREICLWGR